MENKGANEILYCQVEHTCVCIFVVIKYAADNQNKYF